MIAVDDKLRGKGIGSWLVQRFEDDTRANDDIQALVLDTECVNKAALRLYQCKINSLRILPHKEVQELLPKR